MKKVNFGCIGMFAIGILSWVVVGFIFLLIGMALGFFKVF